MNELIDAASDLYKSMIRRGDPNGADIVANLVSNLQMQSDALKFYADEDAWPNLTNDLSRRLFDVLTPALMDAGARARSAVGIPSRWT